MLTLKTKQTLFIITMTNAQDIRAQINELNQQIKGLPLSQAKELIEKVNELNRMIIKAAK